MKRIIVLLFSLLVLISMPSCKENKIKPDEGGAKQEQKGPEALPETIWSCSFMSLTWELYFMNDTDVQITWRNKDRQSKSARGKYTKEGDILSFTQPFMIDEVRNYDSSQALIGYEIKDATITGNKMLVSMTVKVVAFGPVSVAPGDYQASFVWQQ